MSKEDLLQKISSLEERFENLTKKQIDTIDSVFEDYAESDFFGTERQLDPRGDGREVIDEWFEQFEENEDGEPVDEDGNVIEDFDGEFARIDGPVSLKDTFDVLKDDIKGNNDEEDLEGYFNLINDIEEALDEQK